MSPTMATSDPIADQIIDLNALIVRYEERLATNKPPLNEHELRGYNKEILKARNKIKDLQSMSTAKS